MVKLSKHYSSNFKGPVDLSPIEIYVESGGEDLPPDVVEWDCIVHTPQDEFKSTTCAMCRVNPVDGLFEHTVKEFSVQDSDDNVFSVGLKVCGSCSYEMELVDYAKMNPAGSSSVTEKALAGKLRSYIAEGVLPEDGNRKLGSCYFCQEDIPNHPEIMMLPIDATSHNYGVADLAHVCQECFSRVDYSLDYHHSVTDQCMNCGQRYPVSEEEMDQRKYQESLGNHLCHVCFIKSYGTTTSNRFSYLTCNGCRKSMVVDKTMYLGIDRLPTPSEYKCRDCANIPPLMLPPAMSEESISQNWNDDIKVVVYIDINTKDIKYCIMIKEGDSSAFWKPIYYDTDSYDTTFEAMFSGLDKCDELFERRFNKDKLWM
jgi:hypothetical protein